MAMPVTITTADRRVVVKGEQVFNYYGMVECRIITDPDATGWFYVSQNGGQRELLNGERICSLGHARRMGWL